MNTEDTNVTTADDMSAESIVAERFGADKVKQWRKEYGPRKLSVVVVGDLMAILMPIMADHVSQYSTIVAQGDGLDKGARYLLDALWIDGDKQMLDDEEYFISAMMQVQRLLEVKKSFVIKL